MITLLGECGNRHANDHIACLLPQVDVAEFR